MRKRKPSREFEGYQRSGGKLVSNCEMCGEEIPFVHLRTENDHAYCADCLKIQQERKKQEDEREDELFDKEEDET